MRLSFGPDVTTLSMEDGSAVTVGPSPAALAAACFHHDPPTARELEHAIDIVEDALMAAMPPRGSGVPLTTIEPALRLLPGLADMDSALSREAIEDMFQLLASIASGQPTSSASIVADRRVAAALLVTRECMHHLDFEWIRVARSPAS
jgi:exopolyphosphatase/pppGpp-phosphohydrolase